MSNIGMVQQAHDLFFEKAKTEDLIFKVQGYSKRVPHVERPCMRHMHYTWTRTTDRPAQRAE
jgi:hypothetical protein